MIKRFWFGAEAASWLEALDADRAAPAVVRPLRAVLCASLPELEPDPPFEVIGIEWFADLGHLADADRWRATAVPSSAPAPGPGVPAIGPGPVVAEEVVLRGADWLQRRWATGGSRLKHMALARRATGLSPTAFSARWKSRAGQVGRAGRVVVIPDDARGSAYVQNHPVAHLAAPYDAVNEVYLEDAAALRTRADWLRSTLAAGGEDDLVGESWFVAAREEPVSVRPPVARRR